MGFFSRFSRIFTKDGLRSDNRLESVQKIIGYSFQDPNLLDLGLTHRSFVRVSGDKKQSNERLEFLGDSVLGLSVAHLLYQDYPHLREGDLTKTKAMLVNEITLARIGREIGLNEHIKLSPEEERTGGNERASIVSDAMEAVIGAVYLDGGFSAASDMVRRLIYSRKEEILSDDSQRNYKGDLLELSQGKGGGMPKYEVISEEGPDHNKIFDVVVWVNGEIVGEGAGSSKKEAEQQAAAKALAALRGSGSG